MPPAIRFHPRPIPSACARYWAPGGQNDLPCSIFLFPAPITSSTISTSPHALPLHPPPAISIPGQYQVHALGIGLRVVKMTSPARSFYPRPPPPQVPYPPHPMHSLYTPRQLFLSQANTKRIHLVSGSGWSHGLPSLVHQILASTILYILLTLLPYSLTCPFAT